MNYRVERYDELSSTNNIVKERIDAGEPEGFAVRANAQNGGYGRRGNAWASPVGGLYISILLRPDKVFEDLPTIPHICAIAVKRTIASFLEPEIAENVKIKWPNDVVYTGELDSGAFSSYEPCENVSRAPFKKICGISVEQRDGAVCVGIGINVRRPASDEVRIGDGYIAHESAQCTRPQCAPNNQKPKNIPVYLDDLMLPDKIVDLDILESRLLDDFDSVYSTWKETLLADLREEYMHHFALEGFKARIDENDNSAIECEVVGINERGNLEVIPFGGTEIRTITVGTVRAL